MSELERVEAVNLVAAGLKEAWRELVSDCGVHADVMMNAGLISFLDFAWDRIGPPGLIQLLRNTADQIEDGSITAEPF